MSKYVYTGFLAYKLPIRHLYSFFFFFLSKNSKCVDILVARGQITTTNGELKYLEIQEIEVVWVNLNSLNYLNLASCSLIVL